jgi:copper chaperone CopZ
MKRIFAPLTLSLASLSFAAAEPVIFSIPQMVCGGCAKRITQALEGEKGVSDLQVVVDAKEARFSCDKAAGCETKKLSKKVNQQTGYRVVVKQK